MKRLQISALCAFGGIIAVASGIAVWKAILVAVSCAVFLHGLAAQTSSRR